MSPGNQKRVARVGRGLFGISLVPRDKHDSSPLTKHSAFWQSSAEKYVRMFLFSCMRVRRTGGVNRWPSVLTHRSSEHMEQQKLAMQNPVIVASISQPCPFRSGLASYTAACGRVSLVSDARNRNQDSGSSALLGFLIQAVTQDAYLGRLDLPAV